MGTTGRSTLLSAQSLTSTLHRLQRRRLTKIPVAHSACRTSSAHPAVVKCSCTARLRTANCSRTPVCDTAFGQLVATYLDRPACFSCCTPLQGSTYYRPFPLLLPSRVRYPQSEPLQRFVGWAQKQKVTTRHDISNSNFRYRR